MSVLIDSNTTIKTSGIPFVEMIESAIKAPSSHNTQPWKFVITNNEIQIHPDMSRSLPVVDSDNHALYISLGCAAENLVISAKKFGFNSAVEIFNSGDSIHFIKIKFSPDKACKYDKLVDYIEQRQSTRNKYNSQQVPPNDLKELKNSFRFEGIELFVITGDKIKGLEDLIIEGSTIQFHNKNFVHELVSWFRFSEKEAKEKGDGLWTASMGLPRMNRLIGNIVMKYFVSASSESKRWKKLIQSSSGFALFTVKKNDPENWVNLGRAFQRFGLTATKLNISHSHVNMPCEELEVRKKIIKQFQLETRHPLLLIRFGYSDKTPYSFRRHVNDVILPT